MRNSLYHAIEYNTYTSYQRVIHVELIKNIEVTYKNHIQYILQFYIFKLQMNNSIYVYKDIYNTYILYVYLVNIKYHRIFIGL